jgi:ribonucleotide reductase alpha subunit
MSRANEADAKTDADAAEAVTLPVKRTDGETIEERLTGTAYNNILPARYLRRNADGEVIEEPEDLFVRVAKNIALAEAAFGADRQGTEITVTPAQLKPDHPRRGELAEEVFGVGTTPEDDAETTLTPANVNKFTYDTVVPELPEEARRRVEVVREEFQEQMESLSFTPNCVPPDSLVAAEGGLKPLASVQSGERVHDDEDGNACVESKYENGEKPVVEVETGTGYSVRATPEHYFRVITDEGDYEWRQVKDIESGDVIAVQNDFLDDDGSPTELRATTAADGGTAVAKAGDDVLGRPRANFETPDAMTADLAEWLGLYVGDGTARESGVRVAFDERDTDLLGYWSDLTESVFGFEPTVRIQNDAACEIGQASRRDLYEFLDRNDLLKETSRTATVPEPVLESGRTCIAGFLRGLFEANGTVEDRAIELYTHSESLARRVQTLLLGLGVRSSLNEKEEGYRVTIRKNVCGKRFVDRVGFISERKQAAVQRFETVSAYATSLKIPNQTGRLHEWFQGSDLGLDAYRDLSQFLIDPDSEYHQEINVGIFERYAEEYPELWDAPVAEFVRRDQFYETVSNIDGIGMMAVEDMRVPRRNTYLVSGFVSHNSPTLMNAGDELQQLSACFVDSPGDDLTDIHETATEAAQIFQSGGGMGYAFWKLRPYGDAVGSTGGIASGPITFMRTYDQLCETIAQGGTRRGAQMGVMRVSHPDVIEFIHAKNKDVSLARCLRLNDPDDYTYTSFNEALEEARGLIDEEGRVPEHLRNAVEGHLSNFNISVGVTDDFMDALYAEEKFVFTNPRTEEPHVATEETKEMYERYDLGHHVEVDEVLSIPAAAIWEHVVSGAHENGEPGVIYLERVNNEHSFDVEEHPDHRILATNPCLTGETELLLPGEETATIAELAAVGESIDVLCRDQEAGRIRVREGVEPRLTREGATVVRVQTENGPSIVCTPDHEMRTPDGYVEAGALDGGDGVIAHTGETVGESAFERSTVAYVEDAGTADVYNITVSEHHNYFCRTERTDGEEPFLNVANCGEQPLEEYEACNLGHINLSTLAAEDAPDWRVWQAEHGEEFDSQSAAIEAFLEKAIDTEEFDQRIAWSTRFLENVVTMSDFPVPEIERKVREMRKIGLGIMGLAQLYIQLGVRYGSAEGNEIARQLMTHINHGSKRTSHAIAEERGSFADWADSKYADPLEYREWFESQTGESADDWADGYPIRNHNTTTIAPTGTTSMVGNTTGGCEPIYNVAYYKNVSDDVQGEEMLVEFDDYFLRVLEANDIDVEAVKREAQEQMSANEFDGVEGLDSVPDAIGELFVITADLAGKDHASVQCACQKGVDSAISKTCNFPNSATKEDMEEVYRYIYDHGGKGVTVYRDGTRSKQVLTTRAENAEFADEEEAAAVLVERIEEVFGGIEGFLESEEVRAQLESEIASVIADDATSPPEPSKPAASASASGSPSEPEVLSNYAEKQSRPDVLRGVTQRIETGYGRVYVTINEDAEREQPFELFANTGMSGGFTGSFAEALAKSISVALRSGVNPRELADKLQGIRSPKVAWDKGEQINSIPDAIGVAIRRYLDSEVDKPYPKQQNLTEAASGSEGRSSGGGPEATDGSTNGSTGRSSADEASTGTTADSATEPETDGGATTLDAGTREGTATDVAGNGSSGEDGGESSGPEAGSMAIIDSGESPECPDCGAFSLYFSEGCKTCEACGWSEC